MFDELQTLGIELMVTFWPLQTTPSQHFNEFNTSGYLSTDLTGKTVPFDGSDYLVDTFNSKARDAMFKGCIRTQRQAPDIIQHSWKGMESMASKQSG